MGKVLNFSPAAFAAAERLDQSLSPIAAAIEEERQGPVSTFGWDSVFTVRIENVNKQLRSDDSTPKGFSHTVDSVNSASAEFGKWQIANTGDGKLINFEMPLTHIEVERNGQSVELPDAMATVQVELEFVPHAPLMVAGEETDFTVHQLVIKKKKPEPLLMMVGDASFQGAADPARVFPLAFDAKQAQPGIMDRTIVEVALTQWLNANLDQFAYVFASVNLANKVGKNAFGWLKPTYASYAFQSGLHESDSQLAILCMSEQRDASHLYSIVADGALTQGDSSGTFVISGKRLLDQMIRNALPTAFKGLKKSDAKLSKNGRELSVDKKVHLTQVDHDGKKYDADLNFLTIKLDGAHLVVESHSETQVSPGVHSECSVRSTFTIKLRELPDGSRTLHYELVDEATHHATRHDPGIEIFKWIVIAVGAIVGVVVFALTGGVAGIVAAALVALVFGVMQYLPDMIAAINKGNAPPIDLLATNATDPIHWTGGNVFHLRDVQLNDSLLLTGVLAA